MVFGVITKFKKFSFDNPSENDYFTLYRIIDNKLQKVLYNLPIRTFTGKWDLKCTGDFKTVKQKILPSQNSSNDFYELKLQIQTTYTKLSKNKSDSCEEKKESTSKTIVLRYINVQYQIP